MVATRDSARTQQEGRKPARSTDPAPDERRQSWAAKPALKVYAGVGPGAGPAAAYDITPVSRLCIGSRAARLPVFGARVRRLDPEAVRAGGPQELLCGG